MAKLAGSMKKYEECQDDELIRRLRDGDGSVMDYLMEKYKDLVRRKARLMYLPGADQEDLIQEGMIGLFKAVRDYEKDRDASFSTFADLCISRQIYTAVEAGARKKHAPLNHYVSLSQSEDRDEDKQAYEPEDVWEKSPEELVIDQENTRLLEETIEQELTPLEKQVMDLHLTGMGYREIAKVLGRDGKSTDNALQRSRGKLRRALDKKTEAEIFSNIRQLAGDAIVLLISHRLYLFPQLDQIVWMEGGRAIAAPHETLIKEVPEYAALFEGRYTQEGGAEHEA